MHFPRGQAPVFRCRIRDAVFPLRRPGTVSDFPGCFRYPAALYGQKELLPALPGSPPADPPVREPGSAPVSVLALEWEMALGWATASGDPSEPESAWVLVWV